jgi:NADPH:quinone reductase-like Zn-dependent oxidoreductase
MSTPADIDFRVFDGEAIGSGTAGTDASGAVVADGPVAEHLLPGQAAHARGVLDYAAAHAQHQRAEARLAVLMLALPAARAGTGHITGWAALTRRTSSTN